ncbi:uncharacterized protein A1O9_02975 [Exophiala aquamarina CBS 119918]|uniref:Uncharacterized protein n=1 Tax=Exophiala aquamarina CBS 119918 TaxID=1182545 RepID=A0A072PMV4_9EURO|nr:uncharacterized protein A1O9_02975 [Exophiala aquamarina CBS 119918]KEF61409.1 hypothetical protein A1O9_02975 [Exophiala aquamarina CBS 119918]
MNVPKFNEREKALEDEYIRKREAEKFKKTPAAPTPGGSGTTQSQAAQQSGQNDGEVHAAANPWWFVRLGLRSERLLDMMMGISGNHRLLSMPSQGKVAVMMVV